VTSRSRKFCRPFITYIASFLNWYADTLCQALTQQITHIGCGVHRDIALFDSDMCGLSSLG